MQTIVIVGGGVGGFELATRLGRNLGKRNMGRIVLIDRVPTLFWKPMLHSVAAGTIDPATHSIDYLRHSVDNGFEFICGDVVHVDRVSRNVTVRRHSPQAPGAGGALQELTYDRLVLSFGAVTNFFGVPGAQEHCISLDTVEQAETFRKRFIEQCVSLGMQRAAGAGHEDHGLPSPVEIVIVGGGATGVELAADLRHTVDTLVRYRVSNIEFARDVRIRIVERAGRLLPTVDPSVSATASRRLQDIGIEICVDTAVAEVTATEVIATDGRRFPAAITVWAAGVKGPSLCAKLGIPLNRNDQILVDDRLQTLGDPNLFAMGDCSSLAHLHANAMVPPSAQAARQQAIFLADFLLKLSRQTLPAFRFRNYGTLVSFGPFGAAGVLLNAIGKRSVRVRGALAQVMYAYSYRRYVMSNLGLGRMLGQWFASWIRSRMVTPVKWH